VTKVVGVFVRFRAPLQQANLEVGVVYGHPVSRLGVKHVLFRKKELEITFTVLVAHGTYAPGVSRPDPVDFRLTPDESFVVTQLVSHFVATGYNSNIL
jgi:hypothetical protein